jgi:cellulose synthase/poly-beta-1,6-N-acetylglucosamine synthase-like glycosyltransferase
MDAAGWPTFSVIIPTYDRPDHLGACLESMAALHYPPALFDVTVVDDGGRTPLEAVVGPFRSRLAVTLLRRAHAGPGAARNAGAAHGQGRFLAFTDDDCRPAPEWLQVLAARLDATPHTVVGGPMRNALPDNVYATASHALAEAVDAYFNTDPSRALNLFSGNLALSRTDFLATGGFDATLMTSEDRDFCDRCVEEGCRLVYAEEAAVSHVRPLTFRTFWRQHFEYGRGTFGYHKRRAARGSAPVRFDVGFYLHVLRYPFRRHRGTRALALSGLLGVTQAAKTAGVLRQWIGSLSRGPGRETVSGVP